MMKVIIFLIVYVVFLCLFIDNCFRKARLGKWSRVKFDVILYFGTVVFLIGGVSGALLAQSM